MNPTSYNRITRSCEGIPKIYSQENFELFDHVPSVLYFLCNLSEGKIISLSKPAKEISGYSPRRFIIGGIPFFLSIIHPEDYRQVLVDYLKTLKLFKSSNLDLKTSFSETYKLRLKHRNGHWIWIEITFIVLDYSTGSIGRIFGLIKDHSDIKSIENLRKSENMSSTSFSRNSNPISFNQSKRKNNNFPLLDYGLNFKWMEKVSNREKQVLQLIAHGYSSKMIADKLSISTHTVINHRKNLISKFQVNNTAELVLEASRRYWL